MKKEDFDEMKAFCDTEQWANVDGFDGYYSVSESGVVRNNVRGSLLSRSLDKDGYIQISLKKKGKCMVKKGHRLVAQSFIPNPDNKPQVNHKDGNRQNNHKSNLEWATQAENNLHAYRVLKRKDSLKRGIDSDKNVRVLASKKCLKLEFFNIKSCMEFFGVSSTTMYSRLNSGKQYNGFVFSRLLTRKIS